MTVPSPSPDTQPATKQPPTRLAALGSTAALALVLLVPAQRVDQPLVWAYVAAVGALLLYGLPRLDPGLLIERLRPGPGGRDRFTVAAAGLLVFAHIMLAGLEQGPMRVAETLPDWLRGAALAIMLLTGFQIARAMILNPFFSPLIRIQRERGHALITRGPYRWIRHPGYSLTTLALLASGVALDAPLSLVPVALLGIVFIRRTVLEERVLRAELPGYGAYCEQVRYRWAPFVW